MLSVPHSHEARALRVSHMQALKSHYNFYLVNITADGHDR